MNHAILREYKRRLRDAQDTQNHYRGLLGRNLTRARQALRDAKIVAAFEAEPDVRFRVECDETARIGDLAGDMFNPKYDGLTHSRREREYKAFVSRVQDEGATGIVGEYFDGADWQVADSVWGFIGDDWRDSGYDTDVMSATLQALAEHREALAHEMENERPDMYA